MYQQTSKSFVLALLLGCLGWSTGEAWSTAATDRPGILLLAHGGQIEWNEDVRHVADKVDLSIPTEVAFGMANPRTIQEGINRLSARGVTRIVAVPLFVSSYSSVITSTEYLLGLRKDAPADLAMFASMGHNSAGHTEMDHMTRNRGPIKPVTSKVPISMTSALNHHQIVSSILLDRAASISVNPSNEIVLLVAHGPVHDDDNRKWLADMAVLAQQIQNSSHYAGIEYMTLRDDADDPIRKQASEELRRRVEACRENGKTALVVPLLLSYGGVENGIRKRLSGLEYRMPAQGLLPDERIVRWVLDVAQSASVDNSKPQEF